MKSSACSVSAPGDRRPRTAQAARVRLNIACGEADGTRRFSPFATTREALHSMIASGNMLYAKRNRQCPAWLALAALVLFLVPAGAIERSDAIKRIHGAYRPGEEFLRISEYFTGRENFGGRVVRRSEPEHREGYYITVRLGRYPYLKDTENAVRLDIIRPGLLEPETHWFSLGPTRRRSPVILIGLTGPDWPDPEAEPLAWRLAFHDAEGNEFAWAHSFLWGENVPPNQD